jgi:hypothetical protein
MIIEGYLHSDKSPFIDIMVEVKELNIKRKVPFLIDTGSPITILSERDARKLRLNYKELKQANGNIMGLGGFTETFILYDTILHFFSKESTYDLPLKELFVYRNIIEDKEIINQIPSLLGRDVLHEFTVVYDEKSSTVSIEK